MMDISYSQIIFFTAYTSLIIYAIFIDLMEMRIPNWCSIFLFVLFIAFSTIHLSAQQIVLHFMIATLLFVVGLGMYAMSWFGAGDVKLLGAVMLWAGPSNATLFVISLALVSWVLGFALLGLRKILKFYPNAFSKSAVLRRPIAWVEKGSFPFGVAIGAGALVIAPRIFFPEMFTHNVELSSILSEFGFQGKWQG
jgi:prepilin peptidase CpaA